MINKVIDKLYHIKKSWTI